MWTKQFWADLLERSIRATAWSMFATFGAGATGTLSGVDWTGELNVGGFAFVLASLASLVGAKAGARDSASFLPAKLDPPAPRKRR